MKKIFAIFLVLITMAVLISCTGDSSEKFYGTWDASGVDMGGSKITVEELEAMGDYSISDFRLVIKEGGKAYIYSEGEGVMLDWSTTDKGILVGVQECVLENDLILVKNNNITIYLSKTSGSQIFVPPEKSEDGNNNNNENKFVWDKAGNGCGSRIPEPKKEYDVKASTNWLTVEVDNATRDDFYDYVDECSDYGFVGEIGTATSPDLYFMSYDADDYYLEVFYYEIEEYIYIYIRPPSEQNNSNNGNSQNSGNLAKAIEDAKAIVYAYFDDYENEYILPSYLYDTLIDWGYSESDAQTAVNACGVNWVSQAKAFIAPALTYESEYGDVDLWCGEDDIEIYLNQGGFSQSVVTVVMQGINWEKQEVAYLEYLIYEAEEDFFYAGIFNRYELSILLIGYEVVDSESLAYEIIERLDFDWQYYANEMCYYLWDLYGGVSGKTYNEIKEMKQIIEFEMTVNLGFEQREVSAAITTVFS